MECLQGLRRPDSGRVRVLGLDPQRETEALRCRIGSQLQESALPDRLKVWEALDLFASLSPGGADWRVLLQQWGLEEKRRATFASLSGGQRQRLFVALALLSQPEVVFLDELTQGLDPAARRVAWRLIRRVREDGASVVLVTHYMDEAQHLCDRIAIVVGGRVLALDSPQNLINRFADGIRVVFSTNGEDDLAWLGSVPYVRTVACHGPRVEVDGTGPVIALVASALVAHGITPPDLRVEQPTLEDVFLAITGEGRAALE